jgi:Ankyrin repeat
LLSRGARLDIFSAIALDRGEDVRAMVELDPELLCRRMSRNEHGRLPLHHAVVCNRPAMVRLLLQLGADANALDLAGVGPILRRR